MKESVVRRDNCSLCGKSDLEPIFSLEPTPPGDVYVNQSLVDKTQETFPLDLALCHNCGLIQLLDVVNPEILYGDYIYETSISLGLTEHFKRYVDDIVNYVNPPKGSFVVDIGSNDGTLLNFFKNKGLRPLGVDPAHEIAKKATELGIETLANFFTTEFARKIKNERGQANIITANNVIANITDLNDMIKGIRELLAPDGVFVFETGYLVDLIQDFLIDNIYHEHLYYYAVKPLEKFFHQHNMELIDVKRVSTKGGSLRGIAQLANGPRTISPSVSELIAFEKSLKIDSPEAVRTFATRMNAVKTELTSMLNDFKSDGKTIAGYGASVGVTTLIYYFNLGDTLSFLVDDNSHRHNLFTPGYHIPVLSPTAIYERNPDYILLLAWRYTEPILKKHQAYLKQGGHFIVPLPEIKII